VGDTRTLDAGEKIHLTQGGHWSENVIGTNGIGTALATGQPAQVHATEHFCEGIKNWTCAGAPVREPATGKILGVVDISGPPSTYQRGNLSLAVATARQIETALAERAGRERVRLLERCLQRLPTLGNANMLVIDRAGEVVYANGQAIPPAAGQAIPGLDPDEPVERWFARLPEQLTKGGNFDPIQLDGRTVGAMLVLPQRATKNSLRPNPASEADASRGAFSGIIGASPEILGLIARARQLANRRVPLLIQGETGVGKEVLVRAIHGESDPASPLVVFNCGAASRELLGAELFGHVRGAFTGALQEGRPGRFELAHGGILCLDEVGELPLDVQPILLRALEEGVIYRLGDTTPKKIDVRLIAMTNRNLRREVAAGRFRADLFFRLNVTALEIPPLRERAGDVDLLLAHYNNALAEKHDSGPRRYSEAALAVLRRYPWPGNIRELRNFAESMILTGDTEEITPDDLPPEFFEGEEAEVPPEVRLEDIGRQTIRRALALAGGNISEAARRLGIARSTLHRRIRNELS
jgi:transcriptional regulator of acetoin/glycerol metabolism